MLERLGVGELTLVIRNRRKADIAPKRFLP
jgi:hypothetical protein